MIQLLKEFLTYILFISSRNLLAPPKGVIPRGSLLPPWGIGGVMFGLLLN